MRPRLTALTLVVLASLGGLAAAAPEAPGKLAVLPTQFDASTEGRVPTLFDDVVLTAVQQASADSVVGHDDIATMLGFERQKELLACDDVTCMADIGGALGVDRLVVLKIALVGGKWLATGKIINIRTTVVESRSTDFVEGDVSALIEGMPAIVARLFAGGGTATPATAPAPAPSAVSRPQPKTGSLAINTQPPGATCQVGDQAIGTSPCRINGLAPGRYDIRLALAYHEPFAAEVSVGVGAPTQVAFALQPSPVPVKINASPPEAQLSLGDRQLTAGETVPLTPGSYEVTAVREDFEDLSRSFDVRLGPALELNLEMVPGYSGDQLASRSNRLIAGCVFAGITAVATALFIWQAVEAQAALDELQSASAPSSTLSDRLAEGQTSALVADISLITGSVTAALATGLFVSLAF